MYLLKLLTDQGATPRRHLLGSALLSGISSTCVLAIVNMAAKEIAKSNHEGVDWLLAGAFAASVLVYLVSEIFLVARVSADMEAAIHHMRTRLLERLRRADYFQIERFGNARLYESITQGSQSISNNAPFLALSFRSIILVGAIMLYIASISVLAFALVSVVIVGASILYIRLSKQLQVRYQEMMQQENRLFESITDLFDGFKEVRLSSTRSRGLGEAFAAVSAQSTDLRTAVQVHAFQQSLFGQVAFFFLLGVVVFVVPSYSSSFATDIVKITTAVLFMVGPVSGLVQSVTVLSAAESAAERMFALDEILVGMEEPSAGEAAEGFGRDVRSIELRGLGFTYPAAEDDRPFGIGPVDLTVRRGETVFITGGNGSGKSTLIKLLTGLYLPQEGTIRVDGTAIGPQARPAYRELMATVFSDYHLFRHLYGVAPLDTALAQDLMTLMEMTRIATIEDDRFSRVELSAGQRKRLALVAALLEKKPILILDEWAADQDPHFRRKFYREVVPDLRSQGITLIAVTHDDHYFDVADRRLHLDEGRLTEIFAAPHGAG